MKNINSRLFKVLVSLFILGIILGFITYFIGDKTDDYIINYYSLIKGNNLNYFYSLINSILYNYKYAFIILIFGLSLFLSFIIPLLIIFRGISLSFTIISIIGAYKLKGFILALILLIPTTIINELIFILLSYYSLNISIKGIESIKNNSSFNLNRLRNYIIIFILFLGVLLFSSLFEVFISSNIIKFVI